MTAVSEAASVASADTVLMTGLGEAFRNVYITVRMFDIAGDQIVDIAGTFTVTWQGPRGSATLAATFEPSSGTISAIAPTTVTATGPISSVNVALASSTNTVTWQAIVSAFRS